MSKFTGVEDTLFIPLEGRIYSSKYYKDFFYDEKALELEDQLPRPINENKKDEYFQVASFARFYEFDRVVKEFMESHEDSNIINLGCGLETMYFRLKPEKATFYEIDFPDVIRQRKIVLGENENEKLIGKSIFDYSWMDEVDTSKPTFIVVSGVFQYLHKEDIKSLLNKIKEKFKNVQISFDATNKIGLEKSNDFVKATGNNEASMYFYVNNIKSFVKETNTKLVSITPFFLHSKKVLKSRLNMRTRFMCFFGDKLGYSKIITLQLN